MSNLYENLYIYIKFFIKKNVGIYADHIQQIRNQSENNYIPAEELLLLFELKNFSFLIYN